MKMPPHHRRVYREQEWVFTQEQCSHFPTLSGLLERKQNFLILQRLRHPQLPEAHTFVLAFDLICSNGTELLQRYEALTPEFKMLTDLERFAKKNLLNIMQQHFFGAQI